MALSSWAPTLGRGEPGPFLSIPEGTVVHGKFLLLLHIPNKCQFVWSLLGDFFQGVCHCSSGLHIKQEVGSLGRVHS